MVTFSGLVGRALWDVVTTGSVPVAPIDVVCLFVDYFFAIIL